VINVYTAEPGSETEQHGTCGTGPRRSPRNTPSRLHPPPDTPTVRDPAGSRGASVAARLQVGSAA
jgi:hypothetical protein